MTDAILAWAKDVKSDTYPNDQESYGLTDETLKELGQLTAGKSAKG
jgi:hypothetical protein